MSTILLPYPAAYGTSPLECGEIAARNVTLEMDCFQNHHLKRWKIWVNLFNYTAVTLKSGSCRVT